MRYPVDILYRAVRPLLFRLSAEFAHDLALRTLPYLLSLEPKTDQPELATKLWGLKFSNPIGLAAGADKDARGAEHWKKLGFGFQELGTVTPRPQPGNPKPRIARRKDCLVNRMGFPSCGVDSFEVNLSKGRSNAGMPIGLNFGPNKETPVERVIEDYVTLMARLGKYADFVVINVSSPNTPGLRDWQAPERMASIVREIRKLSRNTEQTIPILVKLSPDIDLPMLREVCTAALDLDINGFVATNTTTRDGLGVNKPFAGGVSGKPLKPIAQQFIAEIFRSTHRKLPIIGVGGVFSAEDAFDYIRAGGSLVELYTGLLFEGPGLVRRIRQGLVHLLRENGFSCVSDAIGVGAIEETTVGVRRIPQFA